MKCYLCKAPYYLSVCEQFQSKSPEQRYEIVKANRLCYGCFSSKHSIDVCNCKCKLCDCKHHDLLHRNSDSTTANINARTGENNKRKTVHFSAKVPSTNMPNTNSSSSNSVVANVCDLKLSVLLPTAIDKVNDKFGNSRSARILLDCASQITLVTESFVKSLKLPVVRCTSALTGIDNNEFELHYVCKLLLQSRYSDFQLSIEAVITNRLPYRVSNDCLPNVLANVNVNDELAEMKIGNGDVHILLGAEYYEQCLMSESTTVGQLYL